MRITCPNCGAQYEVPDEVIPHDGRDVQCSNCGMTWFQAHPDNPEAAGADHASEAVADVAEPDTEPGTEPEIEDMPEPAATAQPERRELDPDVAGILREEAAHEAELRAAEAGLESQPDLGLDTIPGAGSGPADSEQPMRDDALAADAAASRRDLLPDIDELNSSLRSDGESTALTPHLSEETEPSAAKDRGGFSRGFALTMVLAALIVVIYTNAPAISDRVPQADGFLNALVTFIDKGRLWLDAQVRAFVS